MLKADFHIHSTVSDGSDNIAEIIEASISRGLDAIAITDHDTLSHQKLIPIDERIKVIAGIEVSAIDSRNMTKAHILGYQIQDPSVIEKVTLPLLERRHKNSLKQIEILTQRGFIFDITKLNRADEKYIYKQHIMEYLVKTGQAGKQFGSFYKSIFKNGGICDFDIEYIDVFEAVKAIKASGGKAVLAHSGQQKNFYLIEQLVTLGLDGLEYNHPANNDDDKKIIKDCSEKYHLFLTGGSDYHGTNDANPVCIGDYLSQESGVDALC